MATKIQTLHTTPTASEGRKYFLTPKEIGSASLSQIMDEPVNFNDESQVTDGKISQASQIFNKTSVNGNTFTERIRNKSPSAIRGRMPPPRPESTKSIHRQHSASPGGENSKLHVEESWSNSPSHNRRSSSDLIDILPCVSETSSSNTRNIPSPSSSNKCPPKHGRLHRRTHTVNVTSPSESLLDPAIFSNPSNTANKTFPKHKHYRSATSSTLGTLFALGNSSDDTKTAPSTQESILDLKFIKLEKTIEKYGRDHPKAILVWNQIGNTQFQFKLYDAALKSYKEALSSYRHVYGEQHLHVALTWVNLGTAQWRLGMLKDALICFSNALEIRKNLLGVDHLEVGNTLHYIGQVYCLKGDREHAIQALEHALQIRRANLGSNHIEVARTISMLANVHLQSKNLSTAMTLYRESLRMKQSLLGRNDPSTILSLLDVANLHRVESDRQTALTLYGEALYCQKTNSIALRQNSHELTLAQEEMAMTSHTIANIYRELNQLKQEYKALLEAHHLYNAAGLNVDTDPRVVILNRRINELQIGTNVATAQSH